MRSALNTRTRGVRRSRIVRTPFILYTLRAFLRERVHARVTYPTCTCSKISIFGSRCLINRDRGIYATRNIRNIYVGAAKTAVADPRDSLIAARHRAVPISPARREAHPSELRPCQHNYGSCGSYIGIELRKTIRSSGRINNHTRRNNLTAAVRSFNGGS